MRFETLYEDTVVIVHIRISGPLTLLAITGVQLN